MVDGGRGAGGGRGKGKKGKAAKKKAAAQAPASHKKPANAHHGKKVGANHTNVQVVAFSKASGAHTAHNGAVEAKPATQQTMTKSKRKRIKKQAVGTANSLLKKQAAAEAEKHAPKALQQVKTSPAVADGNATTASPKSAAKSVVVLTPLAAAATATAKPHVVSLFGGKKKRKRLAALTSATSAAEKDAATVTTSSPKEGQVGMGKKSPSVAKKKTLVKVGQADAPTAEPTSTVVTVASTKRKIAQVDSAAQKRPGSSSASPKNETATAPTRVVKKIILKPSAAANKPKLAATRVDGESDARSKEQPTQLVAKMLAAVVSPITSSPKQGAVAQKPVQVKESTKKESPVEHEAIGCGPVENKTGGVSAPDITLTTKISAAASASERNADKGKQLSSILKTAKASAQVGKATAVAANKANSTPLPDATTVTTDETARSPASSVPTALTTAPLKKKRLTSSVAKGNVFSQGSWLKRQRPTEHVPGNSASDPLQPSAKRNAVSSNATAPRSKLASQIEAPIQASASVKVAEECSTPVVDRPQPVRATAKAKDNQQLVKCTTAETPSAPLSSALLSQATVQPHAPQQRRTSQSVASTAVQTIDQAQIRPAKTQPSSNKMMQPSAKLLKPTVKAEVSPTPLKVQEKMNFISAGVSGEGVANPEKLGIIMDSHAYAQKLMQGESMTSRLSSKQDLRQTQSPDLALALPPRPRNAWGASFGMVPPSGGPSSPSRTLATTPLSSWFLSKGCANFVKQVHFSDDEDSSSSDNEGVSNGDSSHTEMASPKRRASVVKKNAFLESLTTQSNWRSWYGNVDLRNLLDPPLANSDELRSYEVAPLELPDTDLVRSTPGKKVDELEMLEADIRLEKQRGSAFSEQLLMMLQGKTVSGKLLEEEYRPFLKH